MSVPPPDRRRPDAEAVRVEQTNRSGWRWILLILLLAAVPRAIRLDAPVSTWREADTAAIARNFAQHGFRILYPEVDWGGGTPGFVESEFPLYSFLTGLGIAALGPGDQWGRLLSLLCSLATIYGLYLLVRKLVSEGVALWSALFYAILPMNIYYGRSVMPEAALLMCSVFGLYFFSAWLDRGRGRDFILTWLCLSLAVLLKIPTLYLGLPLLFLAWEKHGRRTFRTEKLWLLAGLILLPAALWYYHAHQLFRESGLTFGIWGFGTDKWGNPDLLVSPEFYNRIFFKSIAEHHLTYPGFAAFVIGFCVTRRRRALRFFDWWLAAVVIYFLIVAKGNKVHSYYQLPFVLPASVYAGCLFARFWQPRREGDRAGRLAPATALCALCLAGVLTLSALRVADRLRRENPDSALARLAAAVKTETREDDLLLAVTTDNPLVLYRCERKGWSAAPQRLEPAFLEEKRRQGADYLVGERSAFATGAALEHLDRLLRRFAVVRDAEGYFVLRLEDGAQPGQPGDGPRPGE